MPKITFRVDASSKSPPSLLHRSLAIASGLKEAASSCEITFLLSGSESARVLAKDSGFPLHNLGNGCLPSWNLEVTANAVEEIDAELLIIDDSNIDERYLHSLSSKGIKLVLLDDYCRLTAYDLAILINPNINAHLLPYTCDGKLLLGTEFCPLPEQFDEYHDFVRENPEKVRRILISFPGKDAHGATLAAVKLLKATNAHFLADIVVHPTFSQGEALAQEIGLDDRFVVMREASLSPKRIVSADFAIVAPGHTFNELLLFGMPCALISSDNGEAVQAEYAGRSGLAHYLGSVDSIGNPSIASMLSKLIQDKAERDRMTARCDGIVDGLGRFRLAEELLSVFQQ